MLEYSTLNLPYIGAYARLRYTKSILENTLEYSTLNLHCSLCWNTVQSKRYMPELWYWKFGLLCWNKYTMGSTLLLFLRGTFFCKNLLFFFAYFPPEFSQCQNHWQDGNARCKTTTAAKETMNQWTQKQIMTANNEISKCDSCEATTDCLLHKQDATTLLLIIIHMCIHKIT